MALHKNQHNYLAARRLRREMTLPEGLLWRELRGQKGGVKIRRQHPVGPFVIDFYCAAAKTGFEIDGQAHNNAARAAHDQQRGIFLADQGIKVVRIAASEVLRDVRQVAESIVAQCLIGWG